MVARLVAIGLCAMVGFGCSAGRDSGFPSGGAGGSGGPARIRVVATTTVFADLVRSIGGDHVDVVSLVPKGGDVHTFDPKPSDITRVDDAQLIVANGLGLDDWLTNLAADAGAKAPIVKLADGVSTDRYIVEGGIPNPHLWLDPGNAARYGNAIAAALTRVDSASGAAYDANAKRFSAAMTDLLAEGKAKVAKLPNDARKLISFHDALPYFARAFGLEIAGVIVRAPGQDPSAAEIAALVDAIRSNHVSVVVSEVQFSDKLARTLADETGARVVTDLYDDSLGDPPVDSYAAMIRYDLDRLVAGLAGGG